MIGSAFSSFALREQAVQDLVYAERPAGEVFDTMVADLSAHYGATGLLAHRPDFAYEKIYRAVHSSFRGWWSYAVASEVTRAFLPVLEAGGSALPSDMSLDASTYLCDTVQRPYPEPYNTFMAAGAAILSPKAVEMSKALEDSGNTHHGAWQQLKRAYRKYQEASPDGNAWPQPEESLRTGFLVNWQGILEAAIFRRHAHADAGGGTSPDELTRVALRDMRVLGERASLNRKVFQRDFPRAPGIADDPDSPEPMGTEPFAAYHGYLRETEDGVSCRWTHPSLQSGEWREPAQCSGQYRCCTNDSTVRQAITSTVGIASRNAEAELDTHSGRFSAVELLLIRGIYIARETIYCADSGALTGQR